VIEPPGLTCDGCGAELEVLVDHDCPVLGVLVKLEPVQLTPLEGRWVDAEPVCWPILPGEPVPWARAGRGARGQTYTPRRYAEHLEALGWAMRQAYDGPVITAGELGLHARFYRSSRRNVDLDNLAKAVLDAGTGIVWTDDRLLSRLVLERMVDPERPRTELVVYRAASA
jgi:Holliday junction resolvase RusA-like endonuclease